MKMQFQLKQRYDEEVYRKIIGIIKAFKAVRTYDDSWYLTTGMYRSMVQAMILNLGFDPTEPLYEPTSLHQVLVQGEYNAPEYLEIIKKAQFDADTGILTMDDDTFSVFAQYCEKNGIKYYLLQDADKVDVWEKETTLSLLADLKREIESFNYRAVLSSIDLAGILRTVNDNQIAIAKKIDMEVRKIYTEVEVKNEPEKPPNVIFHYLSIDPMILYVKDDGNTTVEILRFQDILTLRKDVALELVKLKKGEIIEEKGP
jgi:hypothetical protein